MPPNQDMRADAARLKTVELILLILVLLAVIGFIIWRIRSGPKKEERPIVTPQELQQALEKGNPPKQIMTEEEKRALQKLQEALPPPPKQSGPSEEAKRLLDALNPPPAQKK